MDFQSNEQPANPNIIGQLGGQPPDTAAAESQQGGEVQSAVEVAGEVAVNSALLKKETSIPTTTFREKGLAETTTTSPYVGRTTTTSSITPPAKTTSTTMPSITMTTPDYSTKTTTTSLGEAGLTTTPSTTSAPPPPPEVQAYREMFGSAMHPNDKN
jgi:hypothetical protein